MYIFILKSKQLEYWLSIKYVNVEASIVPSEYIS